MNKRNTHMKVPGLEKFKSISAGKKDLEDKLKTLYVNKKELRFAQRENQEQINNVILELEKMEKKQNE